MTGARLDNPSLRAVVPVGCGRNAAVCWAIDLAGRAPVKQLNWSPQRLPGIVECGGDRYLARDPTYRDRAIVPLMALGGLGGLRRSAHRSWPTSTWACAGCGCSARAWGGRERVVPGSGHFFRRNSGALILREERLAGCSTPQCFRRLRGPTTGGPLTEAGCGGVPHSTGPGLRCCLGPPRTGRRT
jgi:hypothetical protein